MKLPFVVEPRLKPVVELIGSEESGKIEIERRGYLTVGEKSFVQQLAQGDAATVLIIGLSRKISRGCNLPLEEAYQILIDIISGRDTGEQGAVIEEEFGDEISEMISSLTSTKMKEDLVIAACLLINRVDPGFEIEDITKVHPDIIDGLVRLYKEEEMKSLEKLKKPDDEQSSTDLHEIEKKPKKAATNG